MKLCSSIERPERLHQPFHHIDYTSTKLSRVPTMGLDSVSEIADTRGLAITHAHPTKLVLAFLAGHVATERFVSNDVAELMGTYLQPPFFSIVLWHFEHSLVLLLIQFAVSLSSRHFLSHIFATPHITGR